MIALSLLGSTLALSAESPSPSIYQLSPRIDGAVIGITTLGSIVPLSLNSSLISPKCPCDLGEVNAFDRLAIGNSSALAGTVSDFTLGATLIAPPLLDLAILGTNRALVEDLIVYSEVLSVSGALITTAKYTVQRPIPLVYGSRDPALIRDPNSYVSFYSGHTSLAFAALSATAMTAQLRYRAGPLPWIVMLGLGGSIAYERVAAGRHFPTDVIAGAVTGTMAGALIPWFHSKPGSQTVIPVSAPGNAVGVGWKTTF